MRASLKKIVSLTMLVIFMMGIGASGFNAKRLAHEIDHARHALNVLADHEHAPQPDNDADPNPEAFNNSDHQLLHAMDHVEPILISSVFDAFPESSERITPMPSDMFKIPPADPEPPFRPPRTTFSI